VSVAVTKTTPCGSLVTVSATDVSIGQTLASSTISYTGGFINPFDSSTVAGTIAFTTPTTKVSSFGTASYSWTFTPSNLTNYNTLTGSVNVSVSQKRPDVSGVITASTILFGQTLASSIITGSMRNATDGSLVPGSFSFVTPSIKPTSTGNQTWIFTPTDTASYTSDATGSVSVAITKTTPCGSLVTVSATDVSIGQTLAASSISYTGNFINPFDSSTVVGTIAFTTPTTKSSSVGTASYSWTFTPVNTTNYNTQTGTVTVQTIKTAPVISGSLTASTITYGQPLSSATITGSMINANDGSPVTGSFSYSSPSTVFTAGSYTGQQWLFRPDASNNYNDISGTIRVTVNPKTPDVSGTITATGVSFGQTLASSSISGSMRNADDGSSVSGSFSFSSPSAKPSATGNQTWVFTPTDTTNYTSDASGLVSVAITKTTPCGSFVTVSTTDILFGQTLASSSISYAGNFINPFDSTTITGTVAFTTPTTKPSSIGTASYGWTFTPSDATIYNTLTGTTSVQTIKATPDVSGTVTASTIIFGQSLSSATVNVIMRNQYDQTRVTGSFAFSSPSTKPSAGSTVYSWTFTPNDATNYNNKTGTVSVVTSKATPDVSGAVTASTIIFGQQLSLSNVGGSMKNSNDSASVAGSFAFSAPSTKPSAGSTSYSWIFTPSVSSNYNTQTGSVTVTTSKATPDVSGTVTASTIIFGQQLSLSNVGGSMKNSNDSASVAGSFAFSAPTTKPVVGSASYSWIFTPTNSSNYNTQTGSVTVTTSKATPDVSGTVTTSTIIYDQQLRASTVSGSMKNPNDNSVVAGSFTFSAPSTKPSVGSTSYAWTFTPIDSSSYNTTTGSVSVVVSKASVGSSGSLSASAIFYGETLNSSTISGTMINAVTNNPVSGSFTFSSPSTKPLTTATHNWTFTPSDTSNNNNASGTITVAINRAVPDNSQAVISAGYIFYGQTLSSATISYSGNFLNPHDASTVPGSIAFTNPSYKPQ
jgi:hypothetical protein